MAKVQSGGRPSTRSEATEPRKHVSRQHAKEQTRQALLKAALKLLTQHSFDSISLREVTREAGVSPTAFYRHFDDMEELGLVLVEEALGTLRQLIREVRLATSGPSLALSKSLDAVTDYTLHHQDHLRFLARERYGGVRRLRRVIRAELQMFTEELAIDLSSYDGLESWPIAGRRVLASLLVEVIVHMAMELLDARPNEAETLAEVTLQQLRMVIIGVAGWKPRVP